jgi:putative flippase GtrA
MSGLVREAFGYALASLGALLADVAILTFLVQVCGWGSVAAAAVSFMSGILVIYLLSVRFVFKNHRLADRRAEFVSFGAIGAVGLAINVGVIFVLVNRLGLHYIAAKGVAAGCTFTFNFFARRQLLFVPRPAFVEDTVL